jgi:hypothetical protein
MYLRGIIQDGQFSFPEFYPDHGYQKSPDTISFSSAASG